MFRSMLSTRPAILAPAALAASLLFCGCDSEPEVLTLDDLTADETTYLTRFVVLERARAVSFADRVGGTALLDSLATAWGDSALPDALALLPEDPDRLAALHRLLELVLEAEADSLLENPSVRRLGAPLTLPAPVPEAAPEEPAEG